MTPAHFEMLIFLKANREFWNVKTMFELNLLLTDFESSSAPQLHVEEDNFVEEDEE